jgi:fumarylacetoacetase
MTETVSFVPVERESDFTLSNIPFGIFQSLSDSEAEPRVGVAIGDKVLDLSAVAETGLFECSSADSTLRGGAEVVFRKRSLNEFIRLGQHCHHETRKLVREALTKDNCLCPQLERAFESRDGNSFFHDQSAVQLLLPLEIGDYTDFYASREHASHLGLMMRGPGNELPANYLHLPIGYHGRASSIIVSGTQVRRPWGQIRPDGSGGPLFFPSQRLDFELELGAIIGKDSALGERVPIEQSENYVFGYVLVNDWSARDVQRWEYQPLGPFNSKNFATSISPWVVLREALEPFRVPAPPQDPPVLDYLSKGHSRSNFDLNLSVTLNDTDVCKCNFRYMYWTFEQMIAHHTSTGCNLRCGDLVASGTVSGRDPGTYGSMIELSWNGKNPLVLRDGSRRVFLEDGDVVTLRGHAGSGPRKVGFGVCTGQVVPAAA